MKKNSSKHTWVVLFIVMTCFAITALILYSQYNRESKEVENTLDYSFLDYEEDESVANYSDDYIEITGAYVPEDDSISIYMNEKIENDQKIINTTIENYGQFSYETVKNGNGVDIFVHNDSEYAYDTVKTFVIFYNDEKKPVLIQDQSVGYIAPNGKFIVHFDSIPEGLEYDISINAGIKRKAEDMSQNISGKLVQNKHDKGEYLMLTKNVIGSIWFGSTQTVFYDEDGNIVSIVNNSIFNFKDDKKITGIELPEFDHYEIIINAYNTIKE